MINVISQERLPDHSYTPEAAVVEIDRLASAYSQ
jgi:hypothetical protein